MTDGQKKREREAIERRREEALARSYAREMRAENMTANDGTFDEDDFM